MNIEMHRLTKEADTPLHTPKSVGPTVTRSAALDTDRLEADVFALFVKTRNLHLYMSGLNGAPPSGISGSATRTHVPPNLLSALCEDIQEVSSRLRDRLAGKPGMETATARRLKGWLREIEYRNWFLIHTTSYRAERPH